MDGTRNRRFLWFYAVGLRLTSMEPEEELV